MTQPIENYWDIMQTHRCAEFASPDALPALTAPPRDGRCVLVHGCARTRTCHLELAAKGRCLS